MRFSLPNAGSKDWVPNADTACCPTWARPSRLSQVSRTSARNGPFRWEPVGDSLFPHLYGPLNRDAVIEEIDFPRAADGSYTLPFAWREPGN